MKYPVKEPTTYQDQVSILKARNMYIPDDHQAEEILKRVNYYRLSAYMLTLKEDNKFYDGVTLDDVYHIYKFDKKLRNMILEILEGIEIAFRTHIAYELAHRYGPMGYREDSSFQRQDYHKEMLGFIEEDISRRRDELFMGNDNDQDSGNGPGKGQSKGAGPRKGKG